MESFYRDPDDQVHLQNLTDKVNEIVFQVNEVKLKLRAMELVLKLVEEGFHGRYN